VAEEELDRLFNTGTIRADTPVWREGMPGWSPYRSARGVSSPPPIAGYETCSRCRGSFPPTDLITLGGGRVCATCKPIVLQGLREGVSAAEMLSDGLWRDGKMLVMNKEASLPARCVKCGVPVNAADFRRKLMWHSPWVYLVILVNLLVYALVALIIRKRATVMVGLCERHRTRRRIFIAIAWALVAGGTTGLIATFSSTNASPGLAVASFFAILGGMVFGVVASRVVVARRITKERIWLGGVHASILETLPEWDGGKE
jgi:hypothetical protein